MEGSSMHSGHCGIRTHGTKQKVPALYCSTMWISTEVRRRFWRQEFITWFLCCGSYLWVRVYKGCIFWMSSRVLSCDDFTSERSLAVLVLLRPTHEPSALHWHCASHLAGRCITLWQLLAGGGTNLGMRSNTCLNSVQFVKYLNLLPCFVQVSHIATKKTLGWQQF